MPGIGHLGRAAFLEGMRGLLTRSAECSIDHVDTVRAKV